MECACWNVGPGRQMDAGSIDYWIKIEWNEPPGWSARIRNSIIIDLSSVHSNEIFCTGFEKMLIFLWKINLFSKPVSPVIRYRHRPCPPDSSFILGVQGGAVWVYAPPCASRAGSVWACLGVGCCELIPTVIYSSLPQNSTAWSLSF